MIGGWHTRVSGFNRYIFALAFICFLARSDPDCTYAHVLRSLGKSENLVEVILNSYLMATRWDFKLCCVASRLLFDLICCLEMEQIYQETVS